VCPVARDQHNFFDLSLTHNPLSCGSADSESGSKSPLWAFLFLIFLIAVPAIVVGAIAFSRIPEDCPAVQNVSETSPSIESSEHASGHWDYTDPSEWGHLQASYSACKDGKKQSPININTIQAKAAIPSETTISLNDFQDVSMALPNAFANKATMSHNGHAVGASANVQGYFKHNQKWYKLLQVYVYLCVSCAHVCVDMVSQPARTKRQHSTS
jgi:hypothetical protein